ncbi:uncharacterized protein EV420DRAFT_1501935 [Desarmillaria tabescens]|uniref:C2H2-type domain-containing protein n=1 Tax=Armillaria tabescens TaxID=1929756 RepID=A0AA39NLM7_ARMTA|nr:uncharacterized protein EV420DRAFT_1501935 [Desarmillaria tabescens]KAK0467917.1 hypothetical protein EV420DRAFT_1501935 [Desarmillaria tabescens]
MSWSSSYLPPSRRSRSRSPGPDYQSEQQRLADLDVWNADEREQVMGLERDRGYNHRRRRSPAQDGGGSRKRRRSMSPYERDRYEPRPRYGDDYDPYFRGHSPPRRGHLAKRAPPDPHTFDYPASLKQYADWFRYFFPQKAIDEDNADKAAEQEAGDGSKPRNGIKSHWEQYKKEFASNQLKTMFEHHRKSPWFAEKYDPSPPYQMLRARIRKEGWRGRLVTFLHELESGKFDPDLNENEPKSPVKDVPANGESKDSNVATESKADGDDELQFNPDIDFDPLLDLDISRDLNGKSDNKRSNKRDWDRGEEIAVRPEGNQIMIRTIPPDIGRIKLEEVCRKIPGFVYLALGDPMQKRNYYRAGWVRFQEDADMVVAMNELSERKIEGFKLHVTHIMRPFLNRVRYAPEIASKPDRLEKDLNNAKALAALLEEEAYKLRHMKVKLEDTLKVDGDSATQGQADAADAAQEPTDDDEDEPMERGSDAVERRIEKIMSDLREQNLFDSNDEALWTAKKTQVSLDLYIEYLRAAFLTCYYCCVVSDHIEALHRKCVKHVRKPLPSGQLEEMVRAAEAEKAEKESKMQEEESFGKVGQDEKKAKKDDRWKRNDERWLDWLDSKIALLINRDGVDVREYGGKSYDEILARAVDPFIKQEDEGKFRCRMCQKLFKATSFVEKHIANKHPESIKEVEDVPYFNNFVLDPYHIQPFTHPPIQMGHTNQMAPPQAYGIQGPLHGHQYQQGPPPPGPWGVDLYFSGLGVYPLPPQRRDDSVGRRLSDRIGGGSATMEGPVIPAGAGLPPKPMSALDTPLSSGNNRRGVRSGAAPATGPPPPPPPDAKEDPRAAAGKRVSYHDMDLVAEGDVELSY